MKDKQKKYPIKTSKKGFTLIETLVAITVLLLAIAGAFTATYSGLKSANTAQNQITAFYLAQDAFEYVRNIRDTYKINAIKNNTPADGWSKLWSVLSACQKSGGGGNGCVVDSTKPIISDISDMLETAVIACTPLSACLPLKYDSNTLKYTQDAPNGSNIKVTNFTRYIYTQRRTIYNPPEGLGTQDELDIVVVVTWKQGITTMTFKAEDSLFDWQ